MPKKRLKNPVNPNPESDIQAIIERKKTENQALIKLLKFFEKDSKNKDSK